MRRLFLIIAVIMILVPTMAQKNHRNAEPDFAAYFMNAYQDEEFEVTNIGQKMIADIIDDCENRNEAEVKANLEKLNSVRMVVTDKKAKTHFDNAVRLADKNKKRYKLHRTGKNSRFYIHQRNGVIMEFFMIATEGKGFVIMDFTGKMTEQTVNWMCNRNY